uniref:Uncharacterized protein n=1 Tax=Chlamydomonas leiostraca TaxID=1034604 RepID=A0A7S0S1P2_9CHLO|mmetsp:Transcript_38027/g.96186  ORF Transcript_38027/g.96186 Transcript_38027/m.96186 type:complete len:131 (+) Transcript_38027:103-495(+)
MYTPTFSFNMSLWLLLLVSTSSLAHGARASKALLAETGEMKEVQRGSWEGSLEVIAVDYFDADPPRGETWYSLRLDKGTAPVTRYSLDVTAVNEEVTGLSSGLRVKVTGEMQKDFKIKVNDLQVLSRDRD